MLFLLDYETLVLYYELYYYLVNIQYKKRTPFFFCQIILLFFLIFYRMAKTLDET